MVVDVERTEKRYWQLKEGMCRNKELVEGRSRWGGGAAIGAQNAFPRGL